MDKKLLKELGNLQKEFEKHYGKGKVSFALSPARINIIGEHIDYVEYFKTAVLPFASKEHYLLLAFRKRNDQTIKCVTLNPGFKKGEFSLSKFKERQGGSSWEDYLSKMTSCKPCWTNYIKASFFHFKSEHPKQHLKGMDLLVFSTIPIAGGASSSSALVVATAMALRKINKIKIDLGEIAETSSKAEWFCGTRGGKMDHATMCFGSLNKALLINFKPFQVKNVSMPKGYSWVTFYTTKADKGNELTAQYNERSAVSRIIIPALLQERKIKFPLKSNLEILNLLPETITLGEFKKRFFKDFQEIKKTYPVLLKDRGKDFVFPVKKYATHHLNEIKRVGLVVKLLKGGTPEAMQKLGKLLNETHLSLRDLYSVSTSDLEKVFKIANSVEGVLGARVMGGGFGGNLLVLVKSENTQALIEEV
ncbi:MAG: galactokinase family protein, partial [bacterium]|nr:galactokinase family protein [bacterium]